MRIRLCVLLFFCIVGVLQATPLFQDVVPLPGHWTGGLSTIVFDLSSDQTVSNFTADLPFGSSRGSVQFDSPLVTIAFRDYTRKCCPLDSVENSGRLWQCNL